MVSMKSPNGQQFNVELYQVQTLQSQGLDINRGIDMNFLRKFYRTYMRFEHKQPVSKSESFNHIRGIQ